VKWVEVGGGEVHSFYREPYKRLSITRIRRKQA